MKLLCTVLLLATRLAAQDGGTRSAGGGGAGHGGAQRLEGRVPAAALPAIDSIIATAVAESLPRDPLIQKPLEGSAKGFRAARLAGGVGGGLLQLRAARIIVAGAVPTQPP